MSKSSTPQFSQILSAATSEIDAELQRLISELLENKHLYQRVKIDYSGIVAKWQAKAAHEFRAALPRSVEDRFSGDLLLLRENEPCAQKGPRYELKNVKLYCSTCRQREVFSCIWAHDLGEANQFSRGSLASLYPANKNYQGIFLAYQCQRCKSDPTLFIVRRESWAFILEGHSPIEEVEVPNEIPKSGRGFFRDSVVAFQSGKSLPAILYLTVFIETFCRRVTGTLTRETGDELTNRYNKLLPPAQSSQMPSLNEWYSRLSEAIHDGREDAELYSQAREEVIRHFEFRRLFRITE